ncbi:hypothetical protein [Kingella oralis]|uniref:hypothetical protein n=1 Tax=Kingella oralis TaxID=505 RepID=UPI002D801076|nr:hypothetical protein [Kingella oralis]
MREAAWYKGSLKLASLVFRLPLAFAKAANIPCRSTRSARNQGSLKPLRKLQPMARQRLADIFPTSKTLLNAPFGDKPSPLRLIFRLPQEQVRHVTSPAPFINNPYQTVRGKATHYAAIQKAA